MELWIWRNLRVEVPCDWEMLQFSRDPREGRCAFADRYQFRLELDWRVAEGKPDFDRMISDYVAMLLEQEAESPEATQCGQWMGVQAVVGGQLTTRFSRHFPREGCLVEVVFLWPDNKDPELQETILSSVAGESEHHVRSRRWRAFGMDLLASSELPLASCRVEPANAEMVFADEKARFEERFARRGMVSEWLHEPVASWLRKRVRGEAEDATTGSFTRAGHQVDYVTTEEPAAGVRRLAGRRVRHRAAAWICPQDGRLYSVSLKGPAGAGQAASELAGARLSCCAATELKT